MKPIDLPMETHILTQVVRQDQHSPEFEVLDWSVHTLSTRGAQAPDGVLYVTGTGCDNAGTRPWSVALKIVQRPEKDEPIHWQGYWRRELLAYTSGLLDHLPGPVVPAQCHYASEETDRVWLWMELLTDAMDSRWTINEYTFAAEQLGRLNGTCAVHQIRPNFPWLARHHARTAIETFKFERAWQHPHVRQVFSATTHSHLERLAEDCEQFLAILDRLPQVFSHFDSKRSNLFLRQRPDQQREVVAIDWADCGIGPLGGELVFLVGASAWFFDWDPAAISDLSAAAFTAYLEGLAAAEWKGDPALIRLGYKAWLSLQ